MGYPEVSEPESQTKNGAHDEQQYERNGATMGGISSPTDVHVVSSAAGEEDGQGGVTETQPLMEHSSPEASPWAENHETSAGDEGDGDSGGNNRGDGKVEIEKEECTLLQDRGWAWAIVFGGCLSHIITGGFERSDGVLFVKFMDRFKESAQLTAWPPALCSTIRLVMGPAASALSNRLSVRASCMLGSFVFALGVVISGLAPNVLYLFFSYGLLQGIGRGLVYAPGLVIVGLYVNKYRGLGVGLSTAGVGLGTFLFPPLVEVLFETYGFQGAFLVLGGLALNLCVVSALFRPLSLHRDIVLGHRKKRNPDDEEAVALTPPDLTNSRRNKNDHTQTVGNPVQQSKTNSTACRPTSASRRKSQGAVLLKSAFQTCFPVDGDRRERGAKKRLVEWSLLRSPPFLFFCFSISLFTAAFKSAFTFLPALAISKGLGQLEAAYLLSISGILDTVGRVLAGVILDTQRVRPYRPLAYNAVIFLITLLSFLALFLQSFLHFAVLFGLYGALTGTYVSQKSVIIVDILGQEKLTSSFGLMICFQGIGTFVGPPLSGLLRDMFGRYNEAFYLGGAAMAAAGGLMIVSNIYLAPSRRQQKPVNAQQ